MCSYAISELWKDVDAELLNYPESERAALRAATAFGVFVVHNKRKEKLAQIDASTQYVIFAPFLITQFKGCLSVDTSLGRTLTMFGMPVHCITMLRI